MGSKFTASFLLKGRWIFTKTATVSALNNAKNKKKIKKIAEFGDFFL